MAFIPNDLDLTKKEALEEVMVQSIIEVFLYESEDNIIEINPGVEPVRLRPVSKADERQVDVDLFGIMD